jgi:hypothetical protein
MFINENLFSFSCNIQKIIVILQAERFGENFENAKSETKAEFESRI